MILELLAIGGASGAVVTSINRLVNRCYMINLEENDKFNDLVEELEEDEVGDDEPYEEDTVHGNKLFVSQELPAHTYLHNKHTEEVFTIDVDDQLTAETYNMVVKDAERYGLVRNGMIREAEDGWKEIQPLPPPGPPASIFGTRMSEDGKKASKKVHNYRAAAFAAEKVRESILKGHDSASIKIALSKVGSGIGPAILKRKRRFRRAPYTRYLVSYARLKFAADAPPKPTEATIKAIKEYVRRAMVDKGVRPSHQNLVMPTVIKMVMTPSRPMLDAARFVQATSLQERRHEAMYGPTQSMSIQIRNIWTGKGTPFPETSA